MLLSPLLILVEKYDYYYKDYRVKVFLSVLFYLCMSVICHLRYFLSYHLFRLKQQFLFLFNSDMTSIRQRNVWDYLHTLSANGR